MKTSLHLEENMNIKANPKGEIFFTESRGVLKIINKSNSTTLWGIELKANFGEDISSFSDTFVPHVEPGKEHFLEYETKINPLIDIKEVIDTDYNGEEINPLNKDLIFNVDQTLAFQISVTNNHDFDLKNITVEKHLPSDIKDIRAIEPFPGDVTILETEKIVNWTISELKTGASASIIIDSLSRPTNVQPYKTGIIISRCEVDSKLSSLIPSIDGDCDKVDLSLGVAETTTPNQWQINLGLRNASEFEIFLKDVKIEVNGEVEFYQEPQLELEGNLDKPIWKHQFLVESERLPEITKKFDYYTLYDITEHTSINYERESNQIFVVKVSSTKFFEPSEVTTYAVTDFITTIDITNSGSATVGKIEVGDTIPSYLNVDTVTAETLDSILEVDFLERPKPKPVIIEDDREKATFETIVEEEVEEQEEEITTSEPVDVDISKQRTYHYVVKDVKIEPGQIIKFKIMGKANKPRVEGSHAAPAIIKAYATHPTKAYTSEAEMEGRQPSIAVEFKRRSYIITSIFTKQTEDSYNIEIPVTNNGDVPLENATVIQPIFTAQYIRHTPPTVDVTIEASNIKCFIKRINVNETITINLNIRTEGPLRQQQATIRIED